MSSRQEFWLRGLNEGLRINQVHSASFPTKANSESNSEKLKRNVREGKDREEKSKKIEILVTMNMMAIVGKHGLVSSR